MTSIGPALILFAAATTLRGQDSACSYDRCALRLKFGSSGVHVVQGSQDAPVTKFGNLLGTADSITRFHYNAFRDYHHRSRTLGLVSTVTTITGAAVFLIGSKDAFKWTGGGLIIIGFPFTIEAAVNRRRSLEELSEAIWSYNRTISR